MYKKLRTIKKRIAIELTDKTQNKFYSYTSDSVQAELRLHANWEIFLAVDHIKYPRNLRKETNPLWLEMSKISMEIINTAKIISEKKSFTEKINEKTKTGPAKRATAREQFEIDTGNQFLADCRTAKKQIKKLNKKIATLQVQQKILLPQLRKKNSEYLAERRAEKEEIARKNIKAISSGEFWSADKDALKDYFHPPFEKNYLADVSEKWRACLFLACESISYKTAYGNWGHKLSATGMGYLCGIDDNSDEWAHEVDLTGYQGYDDFGDVKLEGEVEWAMAELFDVSLESLSACHRQGDLLFCPALIPAETEMHEQEKWNVRESHEIWSPRLHRNGEYLHSDHEITVSHTSHEMVVLPAGSYKLHTLQVADAD